MGRTIEAALAAGVLLLTGCADADREGRPGRPHHDDTAHPAPPDPAGHVYAVAWQDATWIAPPGVGDLVASQLAGTEVLTEVVAVSHDEITFRVAAGDGTGTGTQDGCAPTADLPPADFAEPSYVLATPDLATDLGLAAFSLADVELRGTFSDDWLRVEDGVARGILDTRSLVDAFGTTTGSGSDTCALFLAFGVSCEECGDGSGPYCLEIHLEDLVADAIEGAPGLDVVTRSEVDLDPGCAP